ncbi:hypothetical protein RYZ20_01735 [Thioclava sp. A2]|nr:hypothetical protein [Thioclava sp. A2]MDV7269614.1 hypothetical protein [Thioclava sp. A2]
MTNPIALWLGALVLIAALVDAFAFDWGGFLFLARKAVELIHYVAFWR